jgi:hypothetical protein
MKTARDHSAAADAAWQAELDRLFPDISNARYRDFGRGAPGTKLRELYEAKKTAGEVALAEIHRAREAENDWLEAGRKAAEGLVP